MQSDTFPRLVGDIGGTNARFAWQQSPAEPLSDIDTLACASHASLIDAVRHYLSAHRRPPPRWCAIGIANPVVGDQVRMTNHDWSFSIEAVRRQLGLDRFVVINDFTALALALPVLTRADLRQVGGGTPMAGAPLAVIGPGTGLGVSGLLPAHDGRRAIPLEGEGGHVSLAAADEREERVVAILRRRFGHASAERAVSGPGIVNLHAAVRKLAGEPAQPLAAAEITERALARSDRHCDDALELFFSFLGSLAGNLALSLGARGGVYIGGGIVARLGERIDGSRFRERFESKGRLRGYLESIPTCVVQAKISPALLGAARALEEL